MGNSQSATTLHNLQQNFAKMMRTMPHPDDKLTLGTAEHTVATEWYQKLLNYEPSCLQDLEIRNFYMASLYKALDSGFLNAPLNKSPPSGYFVPMNIVNEKSFQPTLKAAEFKNDLQKTKPAVRVTFPLTKQTRCKTRRTKLKKTVSAKSLEDEEAQSSEHLELNKKAREISEQNLLKDSRLIKANAMLLLNSSIKKRKAKDPNFDEVAFRSAKVKELEETMHDNCFITNNLLTHSSLINLASRKDSNSEASKHLYKREIVDDFIFASDFTNLHANFERPHDLKSVASIDSSVSLVERYYSEGDVSLALKSALNYCNSMKCVKCGLMKIYPALILSIIFGNDDEDDEAKSSFVLCQCKEMEDASSGRNNTNIFIKYPEPCEYIQFISSYLEPDVEAAIKSKLNMSFDDFISNCIAKMEKKLQLEPDQTHYFKTFHRMSGLCSDNFAQYKINPGHYRISAALNKLEKLNREKTDQSTQCELKEAPPKCSSSRCKNWQELLETQLSSSSESMWKESTSESVTSKETVIPSATNFQTAATVTNRNSHNGEQPNLVSTTDSDNELLSNMGTSKMFTRSWHEPIYKRMNTNINAETAKLRQGSIIKLWKSQRKLNQYGAKFTTMEPMILLERKPRQKNRTQMALQKTNTNPRNSSEPIQIHMAEYKPNLMAYKFICTKCQKMHYGVRTRPNK